jgi:diguanylate cyclase (GGDEF)-like protein
MASSAMPRWVRRAYAVLGAWLLAYELHLAVHVALLAPLFNRYVHDAELLAAASLCAWGAMRHRRQRLGWALIAAALFAWTFGEIYYTVALWSAHSIPVPSPADVGYLLVYPFAFCGLTILLRSRIGNVSATLWIDGIIAALAVAAIASAVVFEEVLRTVGGRPISIATNLAYPLGDLLLLGIIVTGWSLRGWRPDRPALLLGAGVLFFWVADSLYLVETAQNTYTQGGVFDVGWWAGITLVSLACWSGPKSAPRRERRESLATIGAPILFALFGLGLLVTATLRRIDPLAVGLATAALMAVIVRLIMTYSESVRNLHASRHEALTDALTGLANRRCLVAHLERQCAAPDGAPAHLVLFDLNGFKRYNDRFGHPAGDALLARVGRHLAHAAGNDGRAYRMGGDEFCLLLRPAEGKPESIIAAAREALSERGEGFEVTASYGAVSLPHEATTPPEALSIADRRLYRQKEARLVIDRDQVRSALMQALQESHPELHNHLSEVAELCRRVALELRMTPEELDEVVRAGELHDVGKMAIPDSILDKPGPLTEQEWAFMRRHTLIGERILAAAPALAPVARLVRSSHERWDGGGYPDGLAAEQIPIGARIVCACDAFHAMTSGRPYARPRTRAQALEELRRCAGSQFDPRVVTALCHALETELAPA